MIWQYWSQEATFPSMHTVHQKCWQIKMTPPQDNESYFFIIMCEWIIDLFTHFQFIYSTFRKYCLSWYRKNILLTTFLVTFLVKFDNFEVCSCLGMYSLSRKVTYHAQSKYCLVATKMAYTLPPLFVSSMWCHTWKELWENVTFERSWKILSKN